MRSTCSYLAICKFGHTSTPGLVRKKVWTAPTLSVWNLTFCDSLVPLGCQAVGGPQLDRTKKWEHSSHKNVTLSPQIMTQVVYHYGIWEQIVYQHTCHCFWYKKKMCENLSMRTLLSFPNFISLFKLVRPFSPERLLWFTGQWFPHRWTGGRELQLNRTLTNKKISLRAPVIWISGRKKHWKSSSRFGK